MRLPVVFLLLVGVAIAEHEHAWRAENEYHYIVESRTLTGHPEISNQYSGVLMKGILKVQSKDTSTLNAKLSKVEYSEIHEELPDGWDSEIPEDSQNFKPLELSEKPFEIRVKHGTIREILVDKNIPTWEVNLLKSAVSQLQIDTRGENMIKSSGNQPPENARSNAMYKTMEDSVSGKCQVNYDINALAKNSADQYLQKLPGKQWKSEGEVYEIVKTKDYEKCENRRAVHYGIPGRFNFEPGSSKNADFITKSSISTVTITGNLDAFTVHSSVTTEKVLLRPNLHDEKCGMVSSRVNLTLSKVKPISDSWSLSSNSESVGNLAYTYDKPFAPEGDDRNPGEPTISESSKEEEEGDQNWNDKENAHKHHHDDSSTSDESSDQSARRFSTSRHFNENHHQPTPTLNEPPEYPILPLFIGNKGKPISSSEGVDLIMKAKTLATEIGSDVQNPSSIPEEQTLEKFTILSDILRTMNVAQMKEIQRDLYSSPKNVDPNDEGENVKRNAWMAFRDAVASVGSGPALVLITEWLRNEKIEGIEAVEIVSVLSKTAKEPTPEYINALFKMATMPAVLNDKPLEAAAIMTFTELVRYSQVNRRSAHNRYPVHTFGSFLPKKEQALLQDYLPYLIENFENGMQNNDYRAQLFMRALGNTAHPKVIAIFEPYLEGKKPSTIFQRMMMLISMDKLITHHPRTIRNLAYRIYQNTGESYKVRALAAYIVVESNPPLAMLQRMAQYTQHDISKHVSSMVKSMIESAAELKTDDHEKLARNARMVRNLLTPENYKMQYSAGQKTDEYLENLNIGYSISSGWLGSDDSSIPSGVYASFDRNYGGFKIPKMESAIGVSSIQQIYRKMKNLWTGDGDKPNSSSNDMDETEKIANLLHLDPKQKDKHQGLFLFRDKYSSRLLSWDEDMLDEFFRDSIKKAAKHVKSGIHFNQMKIQNFDVTVGFPTETGLPFVYSLQIPCLRKVIGKVQGSSIPDYSKGSFGKPKKTDLSVDVRAIYSQKLQSRFGFVTPFEGQKYFSGVDKNIQFHLPVTAKLNYDASQNQIQAKVHPMNKNEESTLFHFSIKPFTARQAATDLKPVTQGSRSARMIIEKDVHEATTLVGEKTRGVAIKVKEIKSRDSPSAAEQLKDLNILREHILFPMATKRVAYYSIDTILVANPSSEQSVAFDIAWDTVSKNEDSEKMSRSFSESTREPSNLEAKEPSNKEPSNPSRRQEMLNEVLKDFSTAQAVAVDLTVEMPGQEPSLYVFTTSVAKNKFNNEWKASGYLRCEKRTSSRSSFEVCIAAQGSSPQLPVFDADKIERQNLQRNVNAEIKFGKTCSESSKVSIRGRQWQSKKYEELWRSARKRHGGMPTTLMDEAKIIIKANSEVNAVQLDSLVNKILRTVNTLQGAEMKETFRDEKESNSFVEFEIAANPEIKNLKFTLKTPKLKTELESNELNRWMINALSAQPDRKLESRNLGEVEKRHKLSSSQDSCTVHNNHVTTFDGSEYKLDMNQCWYVVTMTAPEKNPERISPTIEEDKKMSVRIRQDESDERKRVLAVLLGKTEIEMSKPSSEINVQVNKQKVDLSRTGYHDQETDDNNRIEILRLPEGTVQVQSKKYGLQVKYDGNHVQLKMADKYRDSVRGLCGNFDSEPANDLLTPRNRISPRVNDFAALYILPVKQCKQLTEDFREKEKSFASTSPKLSNVISDREAGRHKHEERIFKHHHNLEEKVLSKDRQHTIIVRTRIVPTNDQTCFSLRPLPTCAPGAGPIRLRTALFPVYCIPNGESAKRLSDRINRGANPDFSQKQPSMKVRLEIAEKCAPAA